MSKIAGLLEEHALDEVYSLVEALDEILGHYGHEVPEDATLDDLADMYEHFRSHQATTLEDSEELTEIFKRLARAAGRTIGRVSRVRAGVKKYGRGIKKAFRSGVKSGRNARRPSTKKRATLRRGPAQRRARPTRQRASPAKRKARPPTSRRIAARRSKIAAAARSTL